MDEGETPQETAVRELKEELQCDVKILRELGAKDFQDNGISRTYYWFLAQIQDGQEPQLGEPKKFSHYEYIPLDELEKYRLSANMQNLAEEIRQKRISLD